MEKKTNTLLLWMYNINLDMSFEANNEMLVLSC